MNKPKAYLNWSSGKDATLALHSLQQEKSVAVDLLFTTINKKYQRVSMHGLHRRLLQAQADAIGIPLEILELDENPSMEDYNRLMKEKVRALISRGYTHSVFGDIFLEDLKKYRESMLHPLGIKTIFPLWKKDTRQLLLDFIDAGFKAIIVCINAQNLPKEFCGRELNEEFLDDLPQEVDPCGENGEFHTFCYDGPLFQRPVEFEVGEKVYKTYPAPKTEDGPQEYGFWFCDLKPTLQS